MREYSDRLALGLLRMHRDAAADYDETVSGEEADEARVSIIRKLERLKVQVDGEAAEPRQDEPNPDERLCP